MTDDDLGFDLEEWYLRHDGSPWGPVDLLTLRDMVSAGRASGSSLVRLETDFAWVRLDSVITDLPDAELVPIGSEPDDPALHVFPARRWVRGFENLGIWLVITSIGFAWSRSIDLEFVILYGVGLFLAAYIGGPERVEVTSRVVRMISRGRAPVSIPLAELVPASNRLQEPFAAFIGGRSIRSRSGAKIVMGYAYRQDDYRDLVELLGLSAS